MQNSAAGHHAAAGDDHHRSRARVQPLGLLDGAHQVVLATAERAAALSHRLRHAFVVVVGMLAVHLGDVDGHRAVDVDREQRDLAGILKLSEGPDQLLDPANGEGWNQNRAASVSGFADDAGQVRVHPQRADGRRRSIP